MRSSRIFTLPIFCPSALSAAHRLNSAINGGENSQTKVMKNRINQQDYESKKEKCDPHVASSCHGGDNLPTPLTKYFLSTVLTYELILKVTQI